MPTLIVTNHLSTVDTKTRNPRFLSERHHMIHIGYKNSRSSLGATEPMPD